MSGVGKSKDENLLLEARKWILSAKQQRERAMMNTKAVFHELLV